MERNNKVLVLPNVKAFISNLPNILYDRGYKINKAFAEKYVDELVDYIYKIPYLPAHDITPRYKDYFHRYGNNLQYVFWKRGNTTWYFFFQQQGDTILVRHISNNWTEGQYIR